jgi:DNA polymerase elongation subunit (family B)
MFFCGECGSMLSAFAGMLAPMSIHKDDWRLFGWDDTPGIVSVWAGRDGTALVWRRVGAEARLLCERERFCAWVYATTPEDALASGAELVWGGTPACDGPARLFVRELAGPEGSYRYLLSGASWQFLDTSVLRGAQARAGASSRPARRLADLGERYYRVGLVEQYLMQTGRTYFGGMAFGSLHRMQIDLETTSLDPASGRIFMAAVRDSQGFEMLLEAPRLADEPGLIRDLLALVRERDPDVIENHNLFGFDLPYLEARAELHRIPLRLGRAPGPELLERVAEHGRRRARYSVAGRELLDTLDAVRRHDFVVRELSSYRLKDVGRAYGLAPSEREYLAGADILATYAREPERVRRYALQDVAEVDALSRRLHVAPFALARMAPRRFERLATAGPAMGILEPMLVRAYLRAGAALPNQQQAPGLEPHAGGGLHLFATGLAAHVVKCDIASLYPSIMRSERIGPACDREQALLHMVDRLTELRLWHKDAARRAERGSDEAGRHDALQAAMKLLINSAYGYMGAGAMALFADRTAADTVTRRGRELLGQVVAALEARGMALIEADTDGVYFATPSSWDEHQERALVAEVARELPPGIRLEYEGRYAAMFSHTVKNYALLREDGTLIVRGAALRSRRSEPFGERFLKQALALLMRDDTAGLLALWQATTARLRSRALPTLDVATSARLSKSPAAYAKSRASHREGPYEALLAAGHEDWDVGARVRVYRALGGRWALLDEAGEAAARDYDVEHYLQVLLTSYAGRMRSAFEGGEFDQLFRLDAQLGLFDVPVEAIRVRWLRV